MDLGRSFCSKNRTIHVCDFINIVQQIVYPHANAQGIVIVSFYCGRSKMLEMFIIAPETIDFRRV